MYADTMKQESQENTTTRYLVFQFVVCAASRQSFEFNLILACITGVIFCVFQANRGESEASAKREWRARGGALKNPACPHTIVQAVPAFKYERGYLIGYFKTRDPRMFFQGNTITVIESTTDRFALKLFGEFNWKYGPIGLICSLQLFMCFRSCLLGLPHLHEIACDPSLTPCDQSQEN